MGLINFLFILKGILLLPIITKLLGAQNYGVWTQLSVTLSLVSPLLLLGLPFSLVRFLAGRTDKKEIREGIYSVFFTIFFIGLFIVLIFLILAPSIGNFLQAPPLFIKILAFIILFECLNSVFFNVLRTFEEIKKYSVLTISQNFGEIGLVVFALFSGYGLLGAILSLFIIRLVIFFILSIFILKKFGIKIPTFSPLKKYLRFGLPTVASNISYWLVTSSDRYLIGFFLGVLYVGYYAPAYAMGNLLNFFIYPLGFLLPSALAKFFDENKLQETRIHLKYSFKYFLLLAVPSLFGLSFLSKPILTIFSTPEIASNSYFITPFIALSILLYGATGIFSEILSLAKKTKIASSIWMAAALINLGLNLFFIPRFGILGAALTTLFAYAFAFLLTWRLAFKELTFEIDHKFIFKVIPASVLMTFFLFWLNPSGLLEIIIAIILGGSIYGILIILFKGIDKKEFDFFKDFFKHYFARSQP